jgi:hypothetical protein
MKHIRLYCYKPKIDGHILDNAICAWTKLWNLSAPKELTCGHSEIGFPCGCAIPLFRCSDAICYTSTMQDEINGIVIRPAHKVVYKNPDRWTYFSIPCTDHDFEVARTWCEVRASQNIRYDKRAIASFFWYKRLDSAKSDICSEACHNVLKNIKGLELLLTLKVPSPLRLAYNVWKSGYDLYDLKTGKVILKGKYE